MDYNHQQWRLRPPIQPYPNPHFSGAVDHRNTLPPPNPYGYPRPYSEGEASHNKRPRFDDEANERRLRLIRDHGSSSHRADPNFGGYYRPNLGLAINHLHGSPRFYGAPPPPPPPPLAEGAESHYFHSKSFVHSSTAQDMYDVHGMLPKQYSGEDQRFPAKRSSPEDDKPTFVDACKLFKKPHRSTRPDNFVIILRGLPGSGKSYLAKMLRDIEVEHGGSAPRIYSMDDYFMTEVEKVDECENSKSSLSIRGKKPVVKTVMEYCYEPEMEEAYRSSMLKAFKRTLDEGAFTFIIVDDRNLRKVDFAQFWAIAKSSGYEVYILEASYKDPAGCAARNVHGFTVDEIQAMAEQWEEAPSFHLRLDAKSLFSGDDLDKSGIQEVDMDMEEEEEEYSGVFPSNNVESNAAEVKELGRSKWSNEVDEDEMEKAEPSKGKIIQGHDGKKAKSVRWGDKGGGDTGFSISAAKKANALSLVIGPGCGYTLKSNPLPEKTRFVPSKKSLRQSLFQDQLRAEHQVFKDAFSKRQVRIGLDE